MNWSKNMRRIGWILFTLMWIPFGCIFIGMIGLPAGSYDWSELPVLTRTGLTLVFGLGIASTVLLVGAPLVSGLQNQAVLARGQTALARVLELHDTGTTINDNPVVRVVLQVEPDAAAPFQAETERLISRLHVSRLQPGAVVLVRYDPQSGAVALLDEGQA